eukprot:6213399-Pleurochrysis_carterae.AAC.2
MAEHTDGKLRLRPFRSSAIGMELLRPPVADLMVTAPVSTPRYAPQQTSYSPLCEDFGKSANVCAVMPRNILGPFKFCKH